MARKRSKSRPTTHTVREPYATIGEKVNERDRAYFAAHPSERHYLRPFVPGEHSPEAIAAMGIKPPGQDDWILVWNVAPGMRIRQPLGPIISDGPANGRMTLVLPIGVIENVLVVGWEEGR